MTAFSGPGSPTELASKDRFGDRIHVGLACAMLVFLPVNGQIAGILLIPLLAWALLRTACWRGYLPSAPRVVMIPAIGWIGFLAASMLWTPDLREARFGLWQQWPVMLVPVLWPILAHWRVLLGCIVAGALTQATFHSISILAVGFEKETLGFAGLGEHPRRLAVWYAATAVGIVAFLLTGQLRRWLWLVAVLVLAAPILLSNSRAALIAMILGIGVVAVLAFVRHGVNRRRLLAAMACGVIVGGSLLAFGGPVARGLQNAWTNTVETVSNDQPEDIRLAWWRSSARQWQTRPMLGFGLGGAGKALETDSKLIAETEEDTRLRSVRLAYGHPHSTYFQILVEGGIVGIGLFAWLIGTIAATAYRTSRHHPVGILALGVLAVWMVAAATDEWYVIGHLLSMLWIAAVLAPFDPHWLEDDPGSKSPKPES